MTTTVLVDFNGMEGERGEPRIGFLPEHANGPVEKGDQVRLIDGEGNACEAEVVGAVLYARPDMATWKGSG